MTIPFWCLLVTIFIPYSLAGIGVYYRNQAPGGVDNKEPRSQVATLEGPGARAYAAQQNAWEALAVFTAAVMINHFTKGDPGPSALAAEIFVVARFSHIVAYLKNWDKLRTAVFGLGFACCIALIVIGARG